jgi:hypothetical protein
MKIRQSVLANFGDFALRCDDLDDEDASVPER